VDWINARTFAVAQALAACADPSVMPRAQVLLRAVQARLPLNGNGTRPAPTGWDAVRGDAAVARLLGAVWRYGWQNAMEQGLRVTDKALLTMSRDAAGPDLKATVRRLYDIAQRLQDPVISRDSMADFYDTLERLADRWRHQAYETPGRIGGCSWYATPYLPWASPKLTG